MTVTQTAKSDNRLGYTQLVFKVDAEIADLHTAQERARALMAASQAELEQISERQSARQQNLKAIHETLDNLTKETTQAHNYAARAIDTARSAEATKKVRELEKALRRMEQDNHKIEAQAASDERQDTTRRGELEQVIQRAQDELSEAERTLIDAEGVKHQAFQELGEAESREVQAWLEGHEQRMNTYRQAMLAEQMKMMTYLEEEAIPRLQDWPEHLAIVRTLRPVEDTFTDALEGQKKMLEALLADDAIIPRGLSPSSVPTMNYYGGDVVQLLQISVDELLQLWQPVGRHPRALSIRLSRLNAVLDEYRRSR